MRGPDNLWQGVNATKRHIRHKKHKTAVLWLYRRSNVVLFCVLFVPYVPFVALVAVARAGGEFARVFLAAAWSLVGGATAWCGVWATSLVTHLRG